MAKETKRKALKIIEKSVKKAIHKGVAEDAVGAAVEHAIDGVVRRKKSAAKGLPKASKAGIVPRKKATLKKLAADPDIASGT